MIPLRSTLKTGLLLFSLLTSTLASQVEKITFSAADGLEVTADLYRPNKALTTPMIVLFHQARSSRGEYQEIAPRLVSMGFNCLAVDQRSGKTKNGVKNETAARVTGATPTYIDAIPDLEAAIAKVKSDYASGPVIIWGSSYSASLVLKLAAEQPNLTSGVLSFSPGEYYKSHGSDYIKTAASTLKVPVFITSAKSEASVWKHIFDAIPAEKKTSFLPATGGVHGSSTLNAKVKENEAYWKAVSAFLKQWLPNTNTKSQVNAVPKKDGAISLEFPVTKGSNYQISISRDRKRWISLASVTATSESMVITDSAKIKRTDVFYRIDSVKDIIQPTITAVKASGSPGAYQFSTTILSPETGWKRYANWWEVLDEKGNLLYRRVLGHPHVKEQPFARSGGPIAINADQTVWIRAHMNDGGYGKNAFKGSVSEGFKAAELNPTFGSENAVTGELPKQR